MKGLRKIGGALAVFTGGAVAKPAETVARPGCRRRRRRGPADPAAAGGGRLVFGFDPTASRSGSWPAAQRLQDSLLGALPGQLDVALTVHGGGKLETVHPVYLRSGQAARHGRGRRLPIGRTRPSTCSAR